jgi:tRNA-dihydrouridine synthase
VPYAERVRNDVGIASMAVGIILEAQQAEAILENGQADLIAVGRQSQFNPNIAQLGSCSASGCRRFDPAPPTTAGPRHARVSNIWSPAGRSTTCICSDSPHHRGWHICPHNLRLDPHIAARLSLLLPVS